MLEECMNKLDQQNDILNEQEEQLALFRSKVRHLEYLMDAFKYSKGIIELSYDKNLFPNDLFFRWKYSSSQYVSRSKY